MLTFNTLLQRGKVDPVEVKLVRHKDTRYPNRPTPFALWMAKDPDFELYQALQSRPVLDHANYIAAFIVAPMGETVFAGIYSVYGRSQAPKDLLCPINGTAGDRYLYKMAQTEHLAEYQGRIVIDWGEGFRSWV